VEGVQLDNWSDPITFAEAASLTAIIWSYTDVQNLQGIEYLCNLKELGLGRSKISDHSPLAGLPDLRHLDISFNEVSDLSSLAGLPYLRSLFIDGNPVTDISSLAGIAKLRTLTMYENPISDFSPLAEISSLRELYIEKCNLGEPFNLRSLLRATLLILQMDPRLGRIYRRCRITVSLSPGYKSSGKEKQVH